MSVTPMYFCPSGSVRGRIFSVEQASAGVQPAAFAGQIEYCAVVANVHTSDPQEVVDRMYAGACAGELANCEVQDELMFQTHTFLLISALHSCKPH